MPDAQVDSDLVSANQHAKTPGLGGLPNGIAVYLDMAAPRALDRISHLLACDRVIGVSIVLGSESDPTLFNACINMLASKHASIDVSGDVDKVHAFIKMTAQHPQLQIVCNISQCSRANKLLTVDKWAALVTILAAHINVAIKITDVPSVPNISGDEFDQAVNQFSKAIMQLSNSVGFYRILFGSRSASTPVSCHPDVWKVFDTATHWASALERNQLFRENAVSLYRL